MSRTSDYWMRLYPDSYKALLSELLAEKEKFAHWKDKLEKERNEAYAQLTMQALEFENTRRTLEKAYQDMALKVTAALAEKEILQQQNKELKELLDEEREGVGNCLLDLVRQKKELVENVQELGTEVSRLKLAAGQTATLNSQLKKGMKHLAACKRKKCSVCAYTKVTFGEYSGRTDKKLSARFQDLSNWIRPVPGQPESVDESLHVLQLRSLKS